MNESNYDFSSVRKVFSRIGLAFFILVVVTSVFQILWVEIPTAIWGEDNWATTSSWGIWIGTFAPLYVIAVPVCLLIMRKLPAQTPPSVSLKFSNFMILLPVCFCLMYGGNLIGTYLSMFLSGGTADNAVVDYAMDTNPIKIVVMVVLAPVLEEYICRKQIIDRTRQYGEKTAVFLSAMVFALLHQNLFQFFYAFGLGLVFAYIYARTGRLRYSILLHGIVNFMGSVFAPWILSISNMEAMDTLVSIDPTAAPEELLALYQEVLPGLLPILLYSMLLLGTAVAGLFILLANYKKVIWKEAAAPLPKGTAAKTAYFNVGMVMYVLLCCISFVLALL